MGKPICLDQSIDCIKLICFTRQEYQTLLVLVFTISSCATRSLSDDGRYFSTHGKLAAAGASLLLHQLSLQDVWEAVALTWTCVVAVVVCRSPSRHLAEDLSFVGKGEGGLVLHLSLRRPSLEHAPTSTKLNVQQ